jgi:hypothetical protein
MTKADAIRRLLSPSDNTSVSKSTNSGSSDFWIWTTISSSAFLWRLLDAIRESRSFERTLWRNAASRFSLS